MRRVENVSLSHQPNLFTKRGWLTLIVGKKSYRVAKLSRHDFQTMSQSAEREPVNVGRIGERTYWWFQHRFYMDNDDLTQKQIYALLITKQQRDQKRIAIAQATVAAGNKPRATTRPAIPDYVKQYVWERDNGQCCHCGSGVELQYDHIIPIALGGSSAPENLQILCGPCNRRKGAGLT